MLNEMQKNEVIDLCRSLIQSPSTSGHEDGVVAKLKEYFEKNGFDSVHVDRYGNVIGCVRGNRPGPKITLTAISTPFLWGTPPNGTMIPLPPTLRTERSMAAAPPT